MPNQQICQESGTVLLLRIECVTCFSANDSMALIKKVNFLVKLNFVPNINGFVTSVDPY